MACENCGGQIKYAVMHGMRRLCSEQCREMVIKREQVFVAPKKMELRQSLQREYLADDECDCTKCRPRGDP